MEKVKAITDDSGHWYVIPNDLLNEFRKDEEDEDFVYSGEFDKKYGKYSTGGDLNCIQLYADIKYPERGINIVNVNDKENIIKPLDEYIKEKHTQEECIGFIDGYKKAQEKLYSEKEVLDILVKSFKDNPQTSNMNEKEILNCFNNIKK
jgi:hypothetical protein